MKNVNSSYFGLVIAFLLPGMVGLFAGSYWLQWETNPFVTFSRVESNVGLFLLVILGSIAAGLELTIVRWLLFDTLLLRKHRLNATDFADLSGEKKLESFRACVDEHYRYHQFWGGMALVIPLLYFGWIQGLLVESTVVVRVGVAVASLGIEVLTIVAAAEAHLLYTTRSRRILTGGD